MEASSEDKEPQEAQIFIGEAQMAGVWANFARVTVHVPREQTEELVLTTHEPTLEPGFIVLPPLSGALVR